MHEWNSHTPLAALAAAAYALNCVAYVLRIPRRARLAILVGSFLVVTGYACVALAEATKVVRGDAGEKEATSAEEKEHDWPLTVGYGLLATFFATSLFLGTNVTVQLYDPLAAIGYAVLCAAHLWGLTTTAAAPVGAACLVLYYVLGAGRKVGHPGTPERMQLVGRVALAVVYAAAVYRHVSPPPPSSAPHH